MKALVIGALGQDGRLLTEELRRRGHDVQGIDRSASEQYGVTALDLCDVDALDALLGELSSDMIFHFAAVHGAAGSKFEEIWRAMLAVNVGSVHTVLEFQRLKRPDSRLVYASSIRAFGSTPPEHVDDNTAMMPKDLYGITKQTASNLIEYYRRAHNLRASALHFSNHESWLRSPQFFIPKLLAILVGALQDRAHVGTLHTLDFCCDWGSADEYMGIAVSLAERNILDVDYVVARGECTYARDLAKSLFLRFGLDYRCHIRETVGGEMSRGVVYAITCGNLSAKLGYTPRIGIEDVCFDILARNYAIARPG